MINDLLEVLKKKTSLESARWDNGRKEKWKENEKNEKGEKNYSVSQ